MIVCRGRLTGLIDWSFVCVGDPAYDLIPARFLLAGSSRARFLEALAPDADTIARARARVAWQCMLVLPTRPRHESRDGASHPRGAIG
jgi:aminoglycoside phosphotransferase (APT) family kinase protein